MMKVRIVTAPRPMLTPSSALVQSSLVCADELEISLRVQPTGDAQRSCSCRK